MLRCAEIAVNHLIHHVTPICTLFLETRPDVAPHVTGLVKYVEVLVHPLQLLWIVDPADP